MSALDQSLRQCLTMALRTYCALCPLLAPISSLASGPLHPPIPPHGRSHYHQSRRCRLETVRCPFDVPFLPSSARIPIRLPPRAVVHHQGRATSERGTVFLYPL